MILSRWLRMFAAPGGYRYVTLGGTELRDIQIMHRIDPTLVISPTSYEESKERYALALEAAGLLKARGCSVDVTRDSFFEYSRVGPEPHIFFFDTEGIFAWADYHERLGDMFQDGTIRDGDALMITSHLGHNPGWPKVFRQFDGEFRYLKVVEAADKRALYRCAHPSFTVYKALEYAGMTSDLLVTCVSSVGYFGSSPMGVYGYAIQDGNTSFSTFVTEARACFVDLKEPILI